MDPTAKPTPTTDPTATGAPWREAEYLADLRRRWQAAWPAGAPREPQYPLGRVPLSEMLRHWARERPQQPAVHFYGHVTSYADLDAQSDRCAALLATHGIGPGDRVAVLLPNCPQFHVVFFGILKLGAIYVPVSPLSQRAELLHALRDSTPCALVALDQLLPLVADARAELGAADPLRTLFVTSYADVLPDEPTLPLPPMAQAPRLVPEPEDHAIDLQPAMAACNAPAPQAIPDIDAPAALNYTGGTTGLPKGCIHTQGDMIDMAAAFGAVALPMADDSVMLGFFPEFWIAGENLCLIFPVFFGLPLVLLARWDAQTFMAAVQHYKVTNASMLVDSAVEVMDHPRVGDYDLRTLRHVGVSSFVKKLNLDYRRRWHALTGATIAETAWGMTETQTCNTFTYGTQDGDMDLRAQPVFVGLPVPGTEFKVCDFATGELLPLGTEGELCVRTPTLLKGYWNKPDATRESLRDGWFHTGDIGVIDIDGYVHYLGRRKEMLKVNGMSVFPAEIETMLGQHPAILGSAVVGRPDEDRGQVPVAFVMLKPEAAGTVDEAALTAWCRGCMAVYKVPQLRIVDALPLTATGKVRKQDLIPLAEALR
ncbi:Long-chain-fatty-acid--CoA ligase [Cupriavidus laharis]|uniref:Long-chain-fatty-acid--CoA ligase n=1 Tax=Cupriavidus laharis TaxID=151654 RepID=A0ABM8XNM3_9BURK|nr:AMP-binding protein [Cupriavidus laharis]CAG9181857.1 Long-chain-fatty-acid--CoA ligase [Cupriavidus laharis]